MRPLSAIARRAALPLMAALGLCAVVPASAGADVFGSISLASASAIPGFLGNQQGDFAHDAALSGNGRFVAFDGSFGGATGVWRRDLQTGAVQAVAAENLGNPAISAPDADLPSISDDGRYVSFTTTARLDPVNDTNPGPDVYVRDMDKDPSEEGAFTLASAVNGSAAGLTYEPTGKLSVQFEELNYGSLASGRSAISADGRRVAFVTTAISNLAGPGTPALQVAVRDLDQDSTELVSVADEPATGAPLAGQPVSSKEGTETYGAVFTETGGKPPIFADPQPYESSAPVGAAISADGSTVAWMGVDIPAQAKMLPGEAPRAFYTEPLWRRIADGPAAPIRRITGGSDPNNPGCAASGETALPGTPSPSDPCQGPFAAGQRGRSAGIWSTEAGDAVPRLSADGYEVAFLSNAPLVSLGEDFGGSETKSDIYVANMHEGLSRTAALRPLTELASADQQNIAQNGPIEDLGISPDGRFVLFTTKRTQFPLGSPAYVSAPAAAPGMLELFDVDLNDDTLTRVTDGFEGGPSEHPHEPLATGVDPYNQIDDGALSPSVSDDGSIFAFSSTASNLAYGDGNTPPLKADKFDGSDAFVVSRVIFNPTPTPQVVSAPPGGPLITPAWRLGLTARSQADGSVVLYAAVPGTGTLGAGAQSSLRVRTKHRGHFTTTVAVRGVASTKKAVRGGGAALVTMTLKLASRYRALAQKRGGLPGAVSVTFVSPAHHALRASVNVSFRRTAKPKSKSKAKPKAKAKSKPATAARKEVMANE